MTRHRTRPEHAAVAGWVDLDDEWEVTVLPVLDRRYGVDGWPVYARPTYDDGLEVCRRYGAEMIDADDVDRIATIGLALVPYLGTPTAEVTLEHSMRHDADMARQLRGAGWTGHQVVMNCLKWWIAGAPPRRSRLKGWLLDASFPDEVLEKFRGIPDQRGGFVEPGEYIQPDMVAHNRHQHDDGTGLMMKRRKGARAGDDTTDESEAVPPSPSAAARPALRLTHPYTRGEAVRALQAAVGAYPDGVFGPATEQAVRRFQRGRGMTDTGVVDAATWAALDAAADGTEVPPDSEGPDTIPDRPRIITTEEWGARPAPSRPLRPAVGIVLHHMASSNRAPQGDPDAELRVAKGLARACQLDHASRGWGDTGQHWTISRGGLILEGRVGTLAAARRGLVPHGAHAGPAANADHWGIECEGTYHLEMVMTPAQWDALVELVRWLLKVGGLNVDAITPHNKWKPTGCPGLLVDRLPELRAAVR